MVLGLGNPLLCDDGVGLAVATALKTLLTTAPIPGVDVLASTRAGFELIDLLHGYRRAVIVDCLQSPTATPGRVRRLQLGDVAGSARLVGVHEISLDVAFGLAEHMDIPMPEQLHIFAIEAADVTTISETMTPDVEAAVTPLASEIYEMLRAAAPPDPADDADFRARRAFYAPPEA